MEEKKVEFYSRECKLAGVLYLPAKVEEHTAGIVLCQGYTGTKEMFLPLLSQAFCEAGYACLIFDYRGWGESEGEKGCLFPQEQVEDIRNALTFLSIQEVVDPERLGLYGTSFGGANAITVASMDGRVKCLVACLPIGNGGRWLRSLRRLWEWREFLQLIDDDRRNRIRGGKSRRMSAFDVVPPEPSIKEAMDAVAKEGLYSFAEDEVSLESVEAIIEYSPQDVVAQISPRPILFIHAGTDNLVSSEESEVLYERAGEPKKLVIIPGATHVDFYLSDAFSQVTALSLDWFRRYLPLDSGS
ncbi:MAG: alpha/beta hydrolase [Dehalococcoidia bacterium]|nr:MAG: alpha/beta hydrolase [Dehalococcoidia bacterium]